MPPREFAPGQHRTETQLIHVLWLTSGLSCDGDTVSMTAATSPSLEDLLTGVIPGMPRVVLYNALLAYETGEDFVRAFDEAADGRLGSFLLVVEGSVPNEEINGEGVWAGFGVDPATGQPRPTTDWIDRLAPRAEAVLALGTCAAYGGIPAMRNNPTGAMGLGDHLGRDWRSRRGLRIVNLPGCPVQPDNITETLLALVLHLGGIGPPPELDEQGRPVALFGQTAHERCDRAGMAESGLYSSTHGDGRCLVKLGCRGPVVKCNVPARGWVNGLGGCPNVGGICMACTMPGFPDRYMPFMEADRTGVVAARATRFTYGPVLKYFRQRSIERKYDIEPEWRRRSPELTSGYAKRW
jgi:hydrogenase small subunit